MMSKRESEGVGSKTQADEGVKRRAAVLPPGQNYEELRARQEAQQTHYSARLYESVQRHLEALNIDNEKTIELLSKEVSLLQATVQWLDISKILFRSQFDLFDSIRNESKSISGAEVDNFFRHVAIKNGAAFEDWDYIKYLSYPVSIGLLEYRNDGYRLTEFGQSFVDFMRMNPRLIDILVRL